MILAMIDAYIEGEKRGLIQVGSPNPVIIHLQQFFASRPRGHGKYDVASATPGAGSNPAVLCLYLDGVYGGEVFCQWVGGLWIPASRCMDCPKNRLKKKGEG